ncbi:hypothetical protein N9Y68_05390 [Luminiphilus sp.]|nr:hypothetical protein [Luminiphilus sp.]
MMRVNRGNISIGVALVILWPVAFLQRVAVGYFRPTDDLLFYVSDNVSQLSRVGIEKNFLFFPLQLLESIEARIIVLSGFMATLYLIVILAVINRTLRKSHGVGIFMALAALSFYHAQIDMHLVRQQISIYFFFLLIFSQNRWLKLLFLCLSILYHEIALALIFAERFCSWAPRFFTKSNLFSPFFVLVGLLSSVVAGSFNLSVLFFCLVFFLNFITKSRTEKRSLIMLTPILFAMSLIAFQLGIIEAVNFERLIGVLVSVELIILLSAGPMQIKSRKAKESLLWAFTIIYPLSVLS